MDGREPADCGVRKMACECCRYHGTEDAYRNEPVVDNERVHALLLFDNGLVVYLPDPLSGCWGIEAVIPVLYCPRCGRKLD